MTLQQPNPKPAPFLKWAGGKRWLVSKRPDLFPHTPKHLIEPFCGSSAVFFSICPETATLSDSNAKLIECYVAIRDNVDGFTNCFNEYCQSHSRDFYYKIRSQNFETTIERAAKFVYLNRVCFNGIYRENLSGDFNVPIETKPKANLKSDDFFAVSKALQSVELIHCDFEYCINKAQHGDFLYVDPPYVTKHNFNGFAKYNQKIFSWSDQVRLASAVGKAHDRGASIVISNADHEEVHALYSEKFDIISIPRSTIIASKSSFRGKTTEMVATNVF